MPVALKQTRQAGERELYELARGLVARQGDSVLRLGNALTIKISGNVLTITRHADRATVLTAIAGDPEMFVTFRPGA
jgi:hypothetical protein